MSVARVDVARAAARVSAPASPWNTTPSCATRHRRAPAAGAATSSASSASPAVLTKVLTGSTLPGAEARGNPPRRKSELRAPGRAPTGVASEEIRQPVVGALELDRVGRRRLALRRGFDLRRGGLALDRHVADDEPRLLDVAEPLLQRDLARQPDLLQVRNQTRREQLVAQRLVVLGRGRRLKAVSVVRTCSSSVGPESPQPAERRARARAPAAQRLTGAPGRSRRTGRRARRPRRARPPSRRA